MRRVYGRRQQQASNSGEYKACVIGKLPTTAG